MRLRLANLSAAVLFTTIFGLAGCGGVKYPACETDGDCKEGEFCLNKNCSECRDDSDCATYAEERVCMSGRCEVKPECRDDYDCESVGEGLVCRNDKCVPECTTDEDCPSGQRCDAQKCVAECTADQECGAGMKCVDGACQDASSSISSSCQPMGGSDVVALGVVSFDFDEYNLTIDARGTLDQNAECLREAPDLEIVMEGHCDERGTQEYNLALGEKRAATVRSYLRNLGIGTGRMRTVSKGENEPVCYESSDSCWSQNRRVQFIQQRAGF